MLFAAVAGLLLFPLLATSRLCDENQYWSTKLGDCLPCTKCNQPQVVITPCQVHKDTVCGPFSAFNIDWSMIKEKRTSTNKPKEMMDTFKENLAQIKLHEEHQKFKKQKKLHFGLTEVEQEDEEFVRRLHLLPSDNDEVLWKKLKHFGAKDKRDKKHQHHEDDQELVSDDLTAIEKQRHLETPKWRNLDTPQHYLNMPFDLNKNTEHKIHFDDTEALELLKSSNIKTKKNFDDKIIEISKLDEKEFKEMSDIFMTPVPVNKTKPDTHVGDDFIKLDDNGNLIKNFKFVSQNLVLDEPKSEAIITNNFSPAERLVLDWQTIILAVAVSSCLLFFLVAGIYSLQHAREWKKLRTYFETDVEELQTWISSKDNKKKVYPNSSIYKATTEVVHNQQRSGQCTYLERIINLKGSRKLYGVPNNVYQVEKEMKLLKDSSTT